MTTRTPAEQVATSRANLAAAEAELDRADAIGDAAAVARIRASIETRSCNLRAAIARVERTTNNRSNA